MFFYVGDNCPIKLIQVEPKLFLDDGWSYQYGVWYKGYSTDCVLKQSLSDIIGGYQPAGKWCVIHRGKIYHPVLRGFPIYTDGQNKTNLKLDGFHIETHDLPPAQNESILSIDEASILIGDILVENTKNFYKYNSPKNMTTLFSGGLDTLTVWAVLDQVTKDYTLSYHVPTTNDKTLLDVLGTEREYGSDLIDKVSKDYWGYHHACFYKEPNWNITGYYAEVYTYRDGEAINAIANYHGKRIDELANETDYLYWFLKRPNIVEKYKDSMLEFDNEESLKEFLWSTIWYDYQMWHIDHNMMFSPFADLRIPAIVHRMSIEDITSCCVTGELQRNIIRRFKPELMLLISDYKNEGMVWDNFTKNFDSIQIDPATRVLSR